MGSLYAKDLVDLALKEADSEYQSDGKYNKYAEELDSVNYFNMAPKNGVADFCSIFISWLAYRCSKPDPSKWDAHYFLYQPDSGEDLAASCGWAAQYFMDNDAFYTNPKDFERGDQIFFVKSNGVYYHTGLVVGWDEKYVYTVEANTSGGKTLKKRYLLNDDKIAGVGRPRYDGWEISGNEGKETENKTWDEIFTDLAFDCYNGKYGNYPDRKHKINALGYGNIYSEVQKRVNMIVAGILKR
jgi:hypothetical protein